MDLMFGQKLLLFNEQILPTSKWLSDPFYSKVRIGIYGRINIFSSKKNQGTQLQVDSTSIKSRQQASTCTH